MQVTKYLYNKFGLFEHMPLYSQNSKGICKNWYVTDFFWIKENIFVSFNYLNTCDEINHWSSFFVKDLYCVKNQT